MASQSALPLGSSAPEPYLVTAMKNVKYLILGGLAAHQSKVPAQLKAALAGQAPSLLSLRALQLSLVAGSVTTLLFLYLLFYLPRVRGIVPQYSSWRTSQPLPTVVPVLTVTILVGFVSLCYGLREGEAGWIGAISGSMGTFAATFGLLGLVPTPKPAVAPARKRN